MREVSEIVPGHVQAVVIEGLGPESYGSNNSKGFFICSDVAEEFDSVVDGYKEWPYLNADKTDGRGNETEFFAAVTKYSDFSFELQGSPDAVERIDSAAERPVAELTSDMGAGDTTMEANNTNLGGKALWIDNEVVVPGSHDGGGDYSSVERGVYSTALADHSANANIYDNFPESTWEGREVTLFTLLYAGGPTEDAFGDTYSDAFSQVKRWRGQLAEAPKRKNGRITVQARGPVTDLDHDNYGMADRSFERPPRVIIGRDSDDNFTYAASRNSAAYESKIFKPKAQQQFLHFQVEGEITIAEARYPNANAREAQVEINSPPMFERDYSDIYSPDERNEANGSQIFEVLAAQRRGDIDYDSPLKELLGPFPDYFQWHPLAWYACLNFSTSSESTTPAEFDLFRPDLSADAKYLFDSNIISTIESLIRRTKEFQIDRFVLGWNGESFNVREVCREWLLRPFGFAEVPTKNGELTVKLAEEIDVEAYDNALDNQIEPVVSEQLGSSSGRSELTDSAKIKVGQLPMENDDGTAELLFADDNDGNRGAYRSKNVDLEFDFRVVRPQRRQWVKSLVLDRILVGKFKMPRLQLELEDWSIQNLDYGVGVASALKDIPIEPAWATDRDGNLTTDFGDDVQWVGRFQKLKYLPQSNTYNVELIYTTGTVVRWRAPSGIIRGVGEDANGNQILTLEAENGDPSTFGFDDSDVSFFTLDDDVHLRHPNGSAWSNEIKEVIDVSTSNQTITVTGTYSTEPVEGVRVELAYPDTDDSGTGYANDYLNGAFDNVARVYMVLGEGDGTAGSAELGADVYGA